MVVLNHSRSLNAEDGRHSHHDLQAQNITFRCSCILLVFGKTNTK